MVTRLTFLGSMVITAVLAAGAAFGAPHYVSPTGTNNSPYLTWADAATNIQSAIDVAVAGETVWVSSNVYVLTNQINITKGISLQSAYGPEATVVNGGYVAGSAVTNNRCIMISNAAALVSGFTFSNGAVAVTSIGGAGVLMYSGILSNCTVINNTLFYPTVINYTGGSGVSIAAGTVTASRVSCNTLTVLAGGAGSALWGGGISASTAVGVPVLISDCVISNNGAGTAGVQGGGVFLTCGTIRSSTVCDNRIPGLGNGGGMMLRANAAIRAEGCTITRNETGYGGGVYAHPIASGNIITITNCTISYNVCDQYAGALYMADAAGTGAVNLYNTIIMGNTNGLPQGIIVRNDGRNSIIKDCTIVSNKIDNNNYWCVALHINNTSTNNYVLNSTVSYNKGGIGVWTAGGVFRNCLITGNSNSVDHQRGGGLVVDASCSNLSVSCCTIAGNTDTNRSAIGAGLRFENTNALSGALSSVSSCIIYSNGISGTDDVYDACAPTNYNALQYSCVGTNPGFTGANIIVANPRFKDYAGRNYRLASSSPCINTGLNQDWMTNAVDLDGRMRQRDGTVDMGAYEFYVSKGSIFTLR